MRPARVEDAPEMAALLNEIIAIGGTTAFEDPVTPENMRDWYVEGPKLYCCHVAVDDAGAVAGFQMINRNPKLPEGIADIATFARQSPLVRGIGTALFAETTAFARAAGCDAINATIRADNVPGLAYYSKMGFLDHDVDVGVPLKDGTPVDRISKRYQLV
ncbi:MAG: GNAT family N-acetyltransferase [Pseudomonadota bacterium]